MRPPRENLRLVSCNGAALACAQPWWNHSDAPRLNVAKTFNFDWFNLFTAPSSSVRRTATGAQYDAYALVASWRARTNQRVISRIPLAGQGLRDGRFQRNACMDRCSNFPM